MKKIDQNATIRLFTLRSIKIVDQFIIDSIDQGYSGNQKNVIQGQRADMENRHTQQRTYSN